jgi:hypothetical protein
MSETLELRVGHCEDEINDVHKTLESHDSRLSAHNDVLIEVVRWKNGDPERGAEDRIQANETGLAALREAIAMGQAEEAVRRIVTSTVHALVPATQTEEGVKRIAETAATAIVKNARDKDKTWVAKAGAIAKILTPAAMIIGSIAGLIIFLASGKAPVP